MLQLFSGASPSNSWSQVVVPALRKGYVRNQVTTADGCYVSSLAFSLGVIVAGQEGLVGNKRKHADLDEEQQSAARARTFLQVCHTNVGVACQILSEKHQHTLYTQQQT